MSTTEPTTAQAAPATTDPGGALWELDKAIGHAHGLLPAEIATEDDEWRWSMHDALRHIATAFAGVALPAIGLPRIEAPAHPDFAVAPCWLQTLGGDVERYLNLGGGRWSEATYRAAEGTLIFVGDGTLGLGNDEARAARKVLRALCGAGVLPEATGDDAARQVAGAGAGVGR